MREGKTLKVKYQGERGEKGTSKTVGEMKDKRGEETKRGISKEGRRKRIEGGKSKEKNEGGKRQGWRDDR